MISPKFLPLSLLLLAALQLLVGAWMAISPTNFYESIATFGADNDHFIRDLSTYNIAMGIALLVSAAKSSWRVPILFLVTIQYFLHLLNHILDINDADSIFLGLFTFFIVAALTILLAALLRLAYSEEKKTAEKTKAAVDKGKKATDKPKS